MYNWRLYGEEIEYLATEGQRFFNIIFLFLKKPA